MSSREITKMYIHIYLHIFNIMIMFVKISHHTPNNPLRLTVSNISMVDGISN